MNGPIITTNGTNSASKLSAIISGILNVVFAIFIISFFSKKMDAVPTSIRADVLSKMTGWIIILTVLWCAMVVYTVYQLSICRSYVDVFEDRVVGRGICNVYQVLDFSIPRNQITNVTYMKHFVFISHAGSRYKIITDAKTAKIIFDYFNGGVTIE